LLGAFALHAAGGKHPALRWWAIPFFVFGLLTKELVVAAPILLAVYDVFVERKRPSWRLYSVYALCTVAVLGLKQLALGGHSSDFVYPYLISPLRPDFMEHLWLQARSYSANLLLAQWTAPFADAGTVAAMNSLSGVVLVVVLLVFSGILLWRDGRFWLLFALGIATWLPTSFVYLSERYLYLPSFAFVGILGLLIATRAARWRMVLSVGLGFYATFHAVALHRKHMEICGQPGSLREMAAQLEPLRERIKPGARLLLINEPGPFLRAQFTEEILRVLLDDPKLSVQVLTMMPGQNGTRVLPGDPPPAMGAGIGLRRNGINKLLLQGLPRQAVQEQEHFPFAWASLTSGAVHRTPELEAHILQSRESVATGIEFILPEPLDDYQILVWEAGSTVTEHPWDRRSKATVRLGVW
jgi:hypothetical protein